MSRTIRTVTPEMHAALAASREVRLSQRAAAAIDTAKREYDYATDAASCWRFGPGQDEEHLAALRRRDGAYRRYLRLCHRIGRNYLRPISLKRGMTPAMRTAIVAHVREIHGEFMDVEGKAPSRQWLMAHAALFAASDDDGRMVEGLEHLGEEASRIAAAEAELLRCPEDRLPELRRRIEAGGYLVDSIEKVSRTNAEYNALIDRVNDACPEDYDGPDLAGPQALAILDKMEAS